MGTDDERPEIHYPCTWTYRLIGQSADALRVCVSEILGEGEFELAASNESRTGRYVSLVLTLTVRDEDQRLSLYQRLADHDAVRLVL